MEDIVKFMKRSVKDDMRGSTLVHLMPCASSIFLDLFLNKFHLLTTRPRANMNAHTGRGREDFGLFTMGSKSWNLRI